MEQKPHKHPLIPVSPLSWPSLLSVWLKLWLASDILPVAFFKMETSELVSLLENKRC